MSGNSKEDTELMNGMDGGPSLPTADQPTDRPTNGKVAYRFAKHVTRKGVVRSAKTFP